MVFLGLVCKFQDHIHLYYLWFENLHKIFWKILYIKSFPFQSTMLSIKKYTRKFSMSDLQVCYEQK